jgi:hypothetical protein
MIGAANVGKSVLPSPMCCRHLCLKVSPCRNECSQAIAPSSFVPASAVHDQGQADVQMPTRNHAGALVRRILKEMSRVESDHFDFQAAGLQGVLPVESAMPGTTLGLVRLAAFASGGALFDTPGADPLYSACLH